MKVSVKNVNGRLFAVTPDGESFPMIHSYIREEVIVKSLPKYRHLFDVVHEEVVGDRRVGVVCAVKVGDEILYGWSKVQPPDQFDMVKTKSGWKHTPSLGIRIAVGKALTRPMYDTEDFYAEVSYTGHLDAYDKLLDIYNRAQRYLVRM